MRCSVFAPPWRFNFHAACLIVVAHGRIVKALGQTWGRPSTDAHMLKPDEPTTGTSSNGIMQIAVHPH